MMAFVLKRLKRVRDYLRGCRVHRELSSLDERQLKYIAERFGEWHRKYYPNLTVKQALEIYPGISIQELIEKVR